jgi:hypothetical protein
MKNFCVCHFLLLRHIATEKKQEEKPYSPQYKEHRTKIHLPYDPNIKESRKN